MTVNCDITAYYISSIYSFPICIMGASVRYVVLSICDKQGVPVRYD
jgi:hypothetical protein